MKPFEVRPGAFNTARLQTPESVIAEQDAQIERLSIRVANAEVELAQTLRILSSEQKAHIRLVNKLCDALGTWTGPYEDAAVKAIKEARRG